MLRLNAGVSALVSTRIYPVVLPQNVDFPAIAFRRIQRDQVERLEPRSSSGLARSRFRLFSTATTYLQAIQVAEAVRLCLQGRQETVISDQTAETIDIQGIFPMTSSDSYDDSTETYQIISDLEVVHEEVQPT